VNGVLISALLSLFAQVSSPDPIFSTVPFDQWLTHTGEARIRWNLHLSEPALSSHQRLVVNLEAEVDGAELARRRGEGRFVVFVQLADDKNRTWQNHQELDLEQVQARIKASKGVFSESFFITPGNYRVSVAVFDSATGEHSLIQRSLHGSALKNDPLPDMWRDLPAVEFLPAESSSDRWYLPSVEGRLRLPVETHHPVEVDLLVNLTPSERFAASTRIQNRNLQALIPATKVLSEVAWHGATLNLEFLDLARRRVTFRQDKMETLDWAKARSALDEVNPGIIDARSLANRRYSADFFLNRIARRIAAKRDVASQRVVIILSAMVFFEPGVEMRPLGIALPQGVKVIYIRYEPRAPTTFGPDGRQRRSYSPGADELAPLLKSLEPHLFNVATPEQFRRTLALILDEVAKL
jgi:hypothetical protein